MMLYEGGELAGLHACTAQSAATGHPCHLSAVENLYNVRCQNNYTKHPQYVNAHIRPTGHTSLLSDSGAPSHAGIRGKPTTVGRLMRESWGPQPGFDLGLPTLCQAF